MKSPLITLLTDFGSRDHYVAAMKGVILGICPEARIVDITHEIPAFQVAAGAYTLAQAVTTFPKGTIHIAVVDPGVGGARSALAIKSRGHYFLGPDNGLLSMAVADTKTSVRQITNQSLFRRPVSNTFHGRDIFAPVAARLAQGLAFSRLGPVAATWNQGDDWRPRQLGPNLWEGRILNIDHFGNITTSFPWIEFGPAREMQLQIGRKTVRRAASTYEAARRGTSFLLCGSSGFLEVAVREGDAAAAVGLKSARIPVGRIRLRLRAAN